MFFEYNKTSNVLTRHDFSNSNFVQKHNANIDENYIYFCGKIGGARAFVRILRSTYEQNVFEYNTFLTEDTFENLITVGNEIWCFTKSGISYFNKTTSQMNWSQSVRTSGTFAYNQYYCGIGQDDNYVYIYKYFEDNSPQPGIDDGGNIIRYNKGTKNIDGYYKIIPQLSSGQNVVCSFIVLANGLLLANNIYNNKFEKVNNFVKVTSYNIIGEVGTNMYGLKKDDRYIYYSTFNSTSDNGVYRWDLSYL